MNDGPHQAKAPVTNATHVKPNVDNMNDGFFDNSVRQSTVFNLYFTGRKYISFVIIPLTSCLYEVGSKLQEPSI